jgi:hypothetical protein
MADAFTYGGRLVDRQSWDAFQAHLGKHMAMRAFREGQRSGMPRSEWQALRSRDEVRHIILNSLRDGNAYSVAQIAAMASVKSAYVIGVLDELQESGHVIMKLGVRNGKKGSTWRMV